MPLPGNFDRWLERPYIDAAEEAERFQSWCEDHNIDFEDPNAEMMYEDWCSEQFQEPDYDDEPDYLPYWMQDAENGNYDD